MKLIELYDGTLFDCQMIKNLLEIEEIESSLKDEIIGTRSGCWRPGGSVKVIVSDFDNARAKFVVKEYEKSKWNKNDKTGLQPLLIWAISSLLLTL